MNNYDVYACEICGIISANEFCEPCAMKELHDEDCLWLKAATCSVGIECDHGYDVCPQCDPCKCSIKIRIKNND